MELKSTFHHQKKQTEDARIWATITRKIQRVRKSTSMIQKAIIRGIVALQRHSKILRI